ncbi:phosphatidylinositol-4-phosphate 5-kinase-domain-containing protein [Cyathus striatus]|nr:phosphatidylinositol-4-phosphate 5-kinase-domain-containing protein [Cyathus striatus]
MPNDWVELKRNYHLEFDSSLIPILLVIAYVFLVIYMKDHQHTESPFSRLSSKTSKDSHQVTERLVRTIHTGRSYTAVLEEETESMPSFISFKYSEFFTTEPTLRLAAPRMFAHLRTHVFDLPPEEYYDSHLSTSNTEEEAAIKPSEDTLGFSGSQFFFTHDKALIVKSVPRGFESRFLLDKLIDAYTMYMSQFAYSLLTPITDESEAREASGSSQSKHRREWNLKPPHFFESTRDLVPDTLKTSAAKSGLADVHIPTKDRPVVTEQKKSELLSVLRDDAQFLSNLHVVDYSILLGRWKRSEFPYDLGNQQRWCDGVLSRDGRWVYKISVMDFLWSQEGGVRPKLTKTAGKAVPEQSISMEPGRYMDAVVSMCEEWVLTREPEEEEKEEVEEEKE